MLTSHRQFGTMTEKVTEYEKLLKSLMTRVDDADASLIRIALERVPIPFPNLIHSGLKLTSMTRRPWTTKHRRL